MRHKKIFRKFGRASSHREAMFRNLATSLLDHGRIETTLAKAKDLRRVSEKLITLSKEDSLHRRRQAYSFITRKDVVHKLFAEVGPKFKERPGGYTRVTKLGNRVGDAAPMAVIELVEEDFAPQGKKSAKKRKTAAPKKAASKKKDVNEAEAKSAAATDEEAGKKAEEKKAAKKTDADASKE